MAFSRGLDPGPVDKDAVQETRIEARPDHAATRELSLYSDMGAAQRVSEARRVVYNRYEGAGQLGNRPPDEEEEMKLDSLVVWLNVIGPRPAIQHLDDTMILGAVTTSSPQMTGIAGLQGAIEIWVRRCNIRGIVVDIAQGVVSRATEDTIPFARAGRLGEKPGGKRRETTALAAARPGGTWQAVQIHTQSTRSPHAVHTRSPHNQSTQPVHYSFRGCLAAAELTDIDMPDHNAQYVIDSAANDAAAIPTIPVGLALMPCHPGPRQSDSRMPSLSLLIRPPLPIMP
ncbi:hypothetical protein AK830_g10380, partial [Neonectria ditissima]